MTNAVRFAASMCALAVLAGSAGARAFSDADVFGQPALEGGSEGRYFTGSRKDPYACSVCHSGGEAPQLTITGLPERLEPGNEAWSRSAGQTRRLRTRSS